MRRIERLVAIGIFALILVVAVTAQMGLLNPAAIGGAVFGSATGLATPDLEDPAMIRRGAGHYDRFCAACHASPERPDQGDALALTPPPPKLHLRVEGWPPEVLFATVKHGIENTAMPAWPAEHRDDEIWAMVAFLTRLPGMDSGTYRQWAGLDTAATDLPPLVADCARCHGADGRGSPDGAFPRLDIQGEAYLLSQLLAFRDGHRASGFMQSAVSGLHDDELAELAAHFAGEAPPAPDAPPDIVAFGIPERQIPACSGCHGPPTAARPDFPVLFGQYEPYLAAQLELFTSEHPRGGGPYVSLMLHAARQLEPDEIAALAAWYAGVGE